MHISAKTISSGFGFYLKDWNNAFNLCDCCQDILDLCFLCKKTGAEKLSLLPRCCNNSKRYRPVLLTSWCVSPPGFEWSCDGSLGLNDGIYNSSSNYMAVSFFVHSVACIFVCVCLFCLLRSGLKLYLLSKNLCEAIPNSVSRVLRVCVCLCLLFLI